MVNIKNPQSNLPPGFRFHPTDEELILHYLRKKVTSKPFPLSIIADVDIYKFDPWELPCRATFGEKEWYFFSPRDRKYPNGARPNRAAASGYWKATGTDKVIVAPPMAPGGLVAGENIGVKKALVFYKGRPPKGVKTNWIMHEYRLADALNYSNHRAIKAKDGSMRLDDWVLCRIYKKSNSLCSESMVATVSDQEQQEEEEAEQFLKETLLPVLRTPPPPPLPPSATTTLKPQKSCSFSNLLEAMDYSMLSSYLIDNPLLDSNAFSAGNMEQSSFTNSTVSYSPDVLQNIPPPPPPPHNMDNRLKRQSSDLYDDFTQQSKKFMVSGSYSNGGNQSDVAQYNFVNQNLLLSPYLHFQG